MQTEYWFPSEFAKLDLAQAEMKYAEFVKELGAEGVTGPMGHHYTAAEIWLIEFCGGLVNPDGAVTRDPDHPLSDKLIGVYYPMPLGDGEPLELAVLMFL